MRNLTWVAKASKLCNLRCLYCYEWNELGSRARMTLSQWDQLFSAMLEQRALDAERYGALPARSVLVLHGGEPLLLPEHYLEALLTRARERLGDERSLAIAMQTNAYELSEAQIELLARFRVQVGVSYDVVSGVRVSLTGKQTEHRVRQNLERLRARGVALGGICVIAKHTAAQIAKVYEFYRREQLPLRVLPLFAGPEERKLAAFSLSNEEIARAMEVLFEIWIADDARVPITPLNDYLEVTLRKMMGARIAEYDRALQGDGLLLVNTNGDLYCTDDAYVVENKLGNVFAQSYREIVDSDAHRRSLAREANERARACTGCAYRGACSTWPLFETRSLGDNDGRCAIASRCYAFIEAWLRRNAFAERDLAALHAESLTHAAVPQGAASAEGNAGTCRPSPNASSQNSGRGARARATAERRSL